MLPRNAAAGQGGGRRAQLSRRPSAFPPSRRPPLPGFGRPSPSCPKPLDPRGRGTPPLEGDVRTGWSRCPTLGTSPSWMARARSTWVTRGARPQRPHRPPPLAPRAPRAARASHFPEASAGCLHDCPSRRAPSRAPPPSSQPMNPERALLGPAPVPPANHPRARPPQARPRLLTGPRARGLGSSGWRAPARADLSLSLVRGDPPSSARPPGSCSFRQPFPARPALPGY